MNRQEHLLIILAEECAEVQQAVTKLLRFGADEGRDIGDKFSNNTERLNYELNQLYAMVHMLKESGLDLPVLWDVQSEKDQKVEKYLLYSAECGTLQP